MTWGRQEGLGRKALASCNSVKDLEAVGDAKWWIGSLVYNCYSPRITKDEPHGIVL